MNSSLFVCIYKLRAKLLPVGKFLASIPHLFGQMIHLFLAQYTAHACQQVLNASVNAMASFPSLLRQENMCRFPFMFSSQDSLLHKAIHEPCAGRWSYVQFLAQIGLADAIVLIDNNQKIHIGNPDSQRVKALLGLSAKDIGKPIGREKHTFGQYGFICLHCRPPPPLFRLYMQMIAQHISACKEFFLFTSPLLIVREYRSKAAWHKAS